MHVLRAIPAAAMMYAAFVFSTNTLGVIQLDTVMNSDEQKKTGVANLSEQQKQELESWINQKFVLKTADQSQEIYLSENLYQGANIRLSDGSLYEIAPSDRSTSSFWLSPVPIKVTASDDVNYPFVLTNTVSGATIKAKKL